MGETLFVYLMVSDKATSAALVRDDGGVQKSIYYVSKALIDTETRYPVAERMAMAFVVAARKLAPISRLTPSSS